MFASLKLTETGHWCTGLLQWIQWTVHFQITEGAANAPLPLPMGSGVGIFHHREGHQLTAYPVAARRCLASGAQGQWRYFGDPGKQRNVVNFHDSALIFSYGAPHSALNRLSAPPKPSCGAPSGPAPGKTTISLPSAATAPIQRRYLALVGFLRICLWVPKAKSDNGHFRSMLNMWRRSKGGHDPNCPVVNTLLPGAPMASFVADAENVYLQLIIWLCSWSSTIMSWSCTFQCD